MPDFIAELLTGRDRLREMGVVPAGEVEEPLDPLEEMIGRLPQEKTA